MKQSPGATSFTDLYRIVLNKIKDPASCWMLGLGTNIDLRSYTQMSDEQRKSASSCIINSTDPLGGFANERLPRGVLAPLSSPFTESMLKNIINLEELAAEKISTIIRGHDPATHLSASQEAAGQTLFSYRDLTILNCEEGLGEPENTAYTFISPEGKVFTHHSKM